MCNVCQLFHSAKIQWRHLSISNYKTYKTLNFTLIKFELKKNICIKIRYVFEVGKLPFGGIKDTLLAGTFA